MISGQTLLTMAACCVFSALPCNGGYGIPGLRTAVETDQATVFKALCEIQTGYEEYTFDGQLYSEDCANVPASQPSLSTAIANRYEAICNNYRIVALSYMELSRLMLEYVNKGQGYLYSISKRISQMAGIARKMLMVLCSIGQLGTVPDMVMYYTYVSEITDYNDLYESTNKENTLVTLIDLHDKVAGSLRANVKATPIGNRLDLTRSTRCRLRRDFKIMERTKEDCEQSVLTSKLIDKYDKLVSEQFAAYAGPLDLGLFAKGEPFELDHLFYVNNVAADVTALDSLFDSYDGKVAWDGAKKMLRETYDLVKGRPEKLVEGFGVVERHQRLFVDLVTIVVLRITWTQVTLAKHIDKGRPQENRLTDMANELSRFTGITGLEQDEFFMQLISLLKMPADQGTLISCIKDKIQVLNENFENLNALADPVDARELDDTFNNIMTFSYDGFRPEPQAPTTQAQAAEMNITRAVTFNNHLANVLVYVDFASTNAIFLKPCSLEDTQSQPMELI